MASNSSSTRPTVQQIRRRVALPLSSAYPQPESSSPPPAPAPPASSPPPARGAYTHSHPPPPSPDTPRGSAALSPEAKQKRLAAISGALPRLPAPDFSAGRGARAAAARPQAQQALAGDVFGARAAAAPTPPPRMGISPSDDDYVDAGVDPDAMDTGLDHDADADARTEAGGSDITVRPFRAATARGNSAGAGASGRFTPPPSARKVRRREGTSDAYGAAAGYGTETESEAAVREAIAPDSDEGEDGYRHSERNDNGKGRDKGKGKQPASAYDSDEGMYAEPGASTSASWHRDHDHEQDSDSENMYARPAAAMRATPPPSDEAAHGNPTAAIPGHFPDDAPAARAPAAPGRASPAGGANVNTPARVRPLVRPTPPTPGTPGGPVSSATIRATQAYLGDIAQYTARLERQNRALELGGAAKAQRLQELDGELQEVTRQLAAEQRRGEELEADVLRLRDVNKRLRAKAGEDVSD